MENKDLSNLSNDEIKINFKNMLEIFLMSASAVEQVTKNFISIRETLEFITIEMLKRQMDIEKEIDVIQEQYDKLKNTSQKNITSNITDKKKPIFGNVD